ncbi:Fe-ARD 1 [Terfezia boudieri ATCC MYA-4762]|uniref:Acireductone dioxygenase n=1 Tax=Terfezia boudieri ATCC MYA-4762 TaxID=1051890 RepID=A0A3N4LAM7_9PEZI|nr:Fe-ARD 1 [Terfezia boudieri ATCC MYA-4762]
MRAYLYDNIEGDQRLPHDSGVPITPSTLESLGIFIQHIPLSDLPALNALASSRAYNNRDEITVSPESMGPAYEGKMKTFFKEHLHQDEEIRWIVDGKGYFDVKDDRALVDGTQGSGQWIRIELSKGDLMVLPAGIYHRFAIAETNYIKAVRLFKDKPQWTHISRSQEVDKSDHRKAYLQSLGTAV